MSGRSGWASSPALRPACGCDRAGTSRGGAPRCSHTTAPATPHRETPARCPHPQARWLRRPARCISPPPSRLAEVVLRASPKCGLGWGRKFAGAAGGRSLRSPRPATGRAACASAPGDAGPDRESLRGRGTARDPATRRAAGSRAEESAGAGQEKEGRRRAPPLSSRVVSSIAASRSSPWRRFRRRAAASVCSSPTRGPRSRTCPS
jgi:hypothetical protein